MISSSAADADPDQQKKLLLDDFKFNADDIDLFNQHHSFSIRGYVSDSRSKDIASNWPFSDKTLQICLQNGVKSLLPPFQSLDSLRNNSCNEEIISNSVGKTAIDENIKSNDQEQLTLTQIKSKKSSLVSPKKTENKKCRIKVKLNTSVEPIKEVTPMASKVCPVCKTFSSSSNTTLNAHIDQCLSGESSMKWTANPKLSVKQHIVKSRIKPRKMRTMVDIYKTAPHCTVEELDARNGTSWANHSSFPDQEFEFQEEDDDEKENENVREAAVFVVPEVADHEGAVYIDTNGTKVRILSVPKVDTTEGNGVRKLMKRGKLGKSVIGKKKSKTLPNKHQHKSLKLRPNSKKSSPEVKAGRKEDVAIGKKCNKVDRGKQPMISEERIYKDDTPIVRPPWACSKRTVLERKLRENIHSTHNATKNFSPTASDETFSESDFRIPSSSSYKIGTPSRKVSQKVGTSPGQRAKKKSPLLTMPSELKHSKGSSCKKFSSSLSVNKERVTKINLKRKFPVLEKTCMGPSQDSLKRQYVVEEDKRGKTSSESTSHLEVSTNEEMTQIFRPENSVASRSSDEDPSCDVQFATEQVSTTHDMLDSQECYKDKETYSADFIQNSTRTDDVTEDKERKQKYFQVDPIQLPEPRGSFFPSLGGDMVSEEFHANSSLIDRDSMSDSPISTISNPSLARSDSDKFSVRSCTSLKDDATRDIIDAINEKYATSYGDWRSMHASTSFKNDHQPCCCSRKEGVSSQGVASSYQEPTLLRKNAVESFNFQPQMFSVGNSSQHPPIPPVAENVAYLHTPASPSKPVLRLMGKNLTVAKTNEDIPPPQQFRPPAQPQVSPMGRLPCVQNEYNNFSTLGYHHTPYQNGYNQPPNNMTNHAFNTMLQSSTYTDYERPQVGCPINFEAMTMHKPSSNPMKDIITIDDSPEEQTRNWASSQYSTHNHNHNHNHNHRPYGYESQGSLAFSNGGFQGYSPFMKVEDTRPPDKWNCTPVAGSSRSSSIYYPPGF